MKKNAPNLIQLFCAATLLGLTCSCASNADFSSKRVSIEIGLPDEKIRAEVLKYTLIGSCSNDVFLFVHKRLKHKHENLDALTSNPLIKHSYGLPVKRTEGIGKLAYWRV